MNLLKAMFKNRDRRVSVIMFIFAIIWLYMSKDIKGIFNYAGDRDPGSRLFPIIIGVLLLVTSVGKFLNSPFLLPSAFYPVKSGMERRLSEICPDEAIHSIHPKKCIRRNNLIMSAISWRLCLKTCIQKFSGDSPCRLSPLNDFY